MHIRVNFSSFVSGMSDNPNKDNAIRIDFVNLRSMWFGVINVGLLEIWIVVSRVQPHPFLFRDY